MAVRLKVVDSSAIHQVHVIAPGGCCDLLVAQDREHHYAAAVDSWHSLLADLSAPSAGGGSRASATGRRAWPARPRLGPTLTRPSEHKVRPAPGRRYVGWVRGHQHNRRAFVEEPRRLRKL